MILKDLKKWRASWIVTGHPRLKRIQIFRLIIGAILSASWFIYQVKNNTTPEFDLDSIKSWSFFVLFIVVGTFLFYVITFPLVIIQVNFDSEATEAVALTFLGYGWWTIALSFLSLFINLLRMVFSEEGFFVDNTSEGFFELLCIEECGIGAAVGLALFFIGRVFAFFSVKLRDSERQGGEVF